jgi:hypothetical protein
MVRAPGAYSLGPMCVRLTPHLGETADGTALAGLPAPVKRVPKSGRPANKS